MSEWSMEPKSFLGTLGIEGASVEVRFTAGLDKAGAMVIEFERFPLDQRSAFISEHFHITGTTFPKFVLLGLSEDGTAFDCDNLILTSLKSEANVMVDDGTTIAPKAGYSKANLKVCAEQVAAPILKWHLKGFESARELSATCPLGVVEMEGTSDARGLEIITGALLIRAESQPADVAAWRYQAEGLCTHLRHVMSFAASTLFGGPVCEFRNGSELGVEVYLNSGGGDPSFPVFSSFSLDAIFQCAVRSHFEPPMEVKNLTFAIKWFCMKASYREATLITAMTVLENLIDSNLSDEDTQILPDKTFTKLRKALSNEIKSQSKDWVLEPSDLDACVKELCVRLSELKRRSLMDKIALLASRWGVDLADIPDGAIQEAKRARDQVVHRGHHRPKSGSTKDLHDHVLTIREVVVRFVLATIGFEGNYLSYLDGQRFAVARRRKADFAPVASRPTN